MMPIITPPPTKQFWIADPLFWKITAQAWPYWIAIALSITLALTRKMI